MAKTKEITLGEQKFTVGRLPIGVLRELDSEMNDKPDDTASDKEKEVWFFDRAVRCISIALSTIDPKWTVEEVARIECDGIDEVFQAHQAILFHSGLVKLKAVKPGEGQEAA